MNFIATVVKDTIRVPAGVHFPDGTRVNVEFVEAPGESGNHSLGQSLAEFIGIVDDLSPDLADNLDHYIHGQPKRP